MIACNYSPSFNNDSLNSKIKELLEKSLVTHNRGDGYYDRLLDEEKFAELIVRECISKVNEWEQDSRNHISYMLGEYFGIEE